MGIFFAISVAILWKTAGDIRRTGRWLFEAKSYKTEVLAQPTPPPNELKQVEWEGWDLPRRWSHSRLSGL